MSSSKPAAPEPTEIDGRYVIEKKLGAGAFGNVYKAKDKELGRVVAIKTIRFEGLAASTASLEDLLARFKREAQVAANLRHPGIVALWDWRNTEGFAYISMEFVDGVGLDRVISRSGKMAVERAAAIGAQVADALGYAHKMGVVHRDIKPANIMIEPGDHVKVTDFGIARVTDSVDHLTATGSLLGTPSYMSPEQARGGKVDGRSDLFSVGCILYEMVAGQKAFRGESITALLFKIITEEPPSLRELDPTVSDEMIRVIGKALSKAPETRYQSGQELAEDLRALATPGAVPTVRQASVPTLPPDTPPGDVPTIASPPTVRPEATIGSAPTVAQPAGTASTRPAAGEAPPLPPTVLTPPTVKAEPPRLPRPAPARPAAARAPAPTPKRGGGGLLVGLAIAAVLGLAVIAGGWYLLGRRPAASTPSPLAEASVPPESTVATTSPAEAPAAEERSEAAPPPAPGPTPLAPRPAPTPRAASTVVTPPIAAPPPTGPPAQAGAPSTAAETRPASDEYAFLDELPSDTPDGRAAGDALARLYRGSGGGSGSSYSTGRFNRRPKVPRDLVPAERAAAATLLFVHMAQEQFHAKTSRYGNLRELADAGVFVLDGPFEADGFRRAGRRPGGGPAPEYDFRLSVEGDGFTVMATPRGPYGRPLMVDDSGFVRRPD